MKKLNLLLMALAACLLTFVSCEKDSELLVEKDAISTPQDLDSQGRSCSMETHMEKLLADPEYRNAHQRKLKRMSEMTITRSANCTNITTLPVAVHFQGVNNPDMDCLRQLAEIQVQVLNEDYQGTNPDIGLWNSNASSFPGVNNAEACLEFCIASQNHPAGFGLNDGDLAITFNSTSGDFVSQWSGYINIFVRANTGVLGYSPLGGSGNGDGVVVDASAFGKGLSCGGISPNAPYDLGRTLTHEMGHYLLLDHIWGGGCGSDDAVNDTPNSSSPYFGCPNVGASTCSSTDMHMNYMDYTNDACMYMFSDGQAGRMENYVLANLSNVINTGTTVCGIPTPSCTDGIQNGDETGIDCGGSTCPPCQVTPTCTDGVQNGDETGIDCGGSNCPPCQTTPTCTDGIQNGDETGIDCGGSNCPPCQQSEEPSCYDGIQNGDETGVDCGGTYSAPCDAGNACTGTTLILTLQLDDFGEETRWAVFTDYGTIQAQGGPYNDAAPGELIQEIVCLTEGDCFYMIAYDNFGDGMCCEHGEGYYFLSDVNGNVLLEASGEFGVYQEQLFCLSGGNNTTNLTLKNTNTIAKDPVALAKKPAKVSRRQH